VEGADRRKQASGTRAPTEPEDVDPTSSQSTAKRGAQHSKNDASKEDTTSIDAAVIQPGKPGLDFHPGMMDGAESGLHGNAPKEENGARKRRHCRHQPSRARLSSADHDHRLHGTIARTAHATERAKNASERANAHANGSMPRCPRGRGHGSETPPRSRSRRSDLHA
jgi:hypothetical protein